jgi:hypothetical protein
MGPMGPMVPSCEDDPQDHFTMTSPAENGGLETNNGTSGEVDGEPNGWLALSGPRHTVAARTNKAWQFILRSFLISLTGARPLEYGVSL